MGKIYLCLVMLVFGTTVLAQKNGVVKGIAYDTLAKAPVASATITVLDKKDSSLITFTMTDNGGRFELKGIPNGDYRLMISHVGYRNSNTFFSIDETNKIKDLGNITMNDVARVLDEVVIESEAPPVTLVGDTVQYNAGSFKTQPNANVEQLLKKLPGVKVEKDGSVSAQGEKVNRVLVDGKEFFGNDPKIATRNLPADAVDKVQVYDRQSDQAQLTGFEDGNYEKTINLKLKKDKKKGLFGKVTAGAGDKERYEGRFNVNSFKGARQLSALGMGNNTNAEGFSFMDILNFTGAMNQMAQGGNVNINISADDAVAMGLNTNRGGINTAWGGGLNYNNIIGKKLDFQSNYFYNRYNPASISHTARQNLTPGASSYYDEQAYNDNLNNGHRVNLNMLYQIDSFHSLRITPSFSYQKSRNKSITDYGTQAEDGTMINEGLTNSINRNEGYNFRNDLIFRKKFRHRGRTLSLSLNTSLNSSEGDGDFQSIINFYNAGNINRRDTFNQQSTSTGDLKGYNARVIYTEPLWRKTLLEFSAGRSNTNSNAEKLTYDYNKSTGKYDRVNEVLSNDFENTYGFNTIGMRMRKQGKKYSYSLGLNWQQAELEGKIISGVKDSIITKDFKNLLPTAAFRYNFTRFKNVTINYNATTMQPSMSQLQPVPDITNPLYIRAGNPDLKQEYSHNVRANLHLVSPYKNQNIFVFLNAVTTQNKIVNDDSLNLATGVRLTRPVNVNGVLMLNSNVNYSMPIRFMKATLQVGTGLMYNRGKQFINSVANNIKTLSLRPSLGLDIVPNDKLNFSVGANIGINTTKYSLPSSPDNEYLSQEYSTSIDWQLPKNFFFNTEFTYAINSQRADGFNTNVPLWNASLSKQFLKYNRGEFKLAVTDLLNRNTAISRSTSQNYIEDREVNTLRRFFLLSFTYSLSKSGLNAGAGGGNMRIISR